MYKVEEFGYTLTTPIPIGRQGETGATTIQIDVSKLVEGYSGYSIVLAEQRSQDKTAFNIESSLSGNTLTWNVTEYDTFYDGHGRIEVRLVKDGVIVKSAIAYTFCEKSLTGNEGAPSPSPSWYDQLIARVGAVETEVGVIDGEIDDINQKDGEQDTAITALETNLDSTIGIPSDYQPVSSLSSTADGYQYINTSVVLSKNSKVRVMWKFNSINLGTRNPVFGRLRATSALYSFGLYEIEGTLRCYYGSGTTAIRLGGADTKIHVGEMSADGFVLDGVKMAEFDDVTFTSSASAYLYSMRHYSGESYMPYGDVTIYAYEQYENDVLTRKLIPCKRRSDGALGMYDTVGNVFLASGSETALVAGDAVDVVGNGQEISYLMAASERSDALAHRVAENETAIADLTKTMTKLVDVTLTETAAINITQDSDGNALNITDKLLMFVLLPKDSEVKQPAFLVSYKYQNAEVGRLYSNEVPVSTLAGNKPGVLGMCENFGGIWRGYYSSTIANIDGSSGALVGYGTRQMYSVEGHPITSLSTTVELLAGTQIIVWGC